MICNRKSKIWKLFYALEIHFEKKRKERQAGRGRGEQAGKFYSDVKEDEKVEEEEEEGEKEKEGEEEKGEGGGRGGGGGRELKINKNIYSPVSF